MAGNERFDDSIGRWLEETAPTRLPQRVLEATFERTRRTRQDPAWRAVLGSLQMPRFVPAFGGAAVVVLATALTLGVVLLPSLGGKPAPSPSATASPSTSSGPTTPIWPQSTLEEVQAAQDLADAGDPRYTWQVSRGRWYQPGQNHPMDEAFFARFLEEELGWEEFRWDEVFAHPDGLVDGDVVYIRCAPIGPNPLYPAAPAGSCRPTIDEQRYETVKVHVAQLARQDPSGIWVVTGWEIIEPSEQITPPSDDEITTSLEAFLQARIDGAGAEALADFAEDDPLTDERVDSEIPLLYATSTGAPYERSEFELVEGPVWPLGWMRFEVSLFAENGETVVEQVFSVVRDGTGRPRVVFGFRPTMENGIPVPVEYGFLDGEVTYRAAHPLEPSQDGFRDRDRLAIEGLLPGDGAPRRVLLMLADPRPIGPGCAEAPAPADAEALARSIGSDPDFESTAPVAVTIGGASALQMDVVGQPGGNSCDLLLKHAPFSVEHRARLYLLDLPGGSARVLAMAVITDDDSFEPVLEFAAPIVDSIELHTP